MSEDIKIIKLEDNINYILVDNIIVNEIEYLFLTNIDNETDFCIRKMVTKNGKQFISGLDDDKEFDLALMHFTKKHNGEI